jgi:hypothetical protein
MNGAITQYTERVAAELARSCAEVPLNELRAWLRIAQVREAMVTVVYGIDAIDLRMAARGSAEIADVARKAIRNIWVHEETHTRYLRALQQASELQDILLGEIFGRLQGSVTEAAARGGLLARLAIAAGVFLGKVPAFARELNAMNVREFCQFCVELEQTAGAGYDKILALAAELERAGEELPFAYSLRMDLTKIRADEAFHTEVFRCIERWLLPDGEGFRALEARQCVQELHTLAEDILGRTLEKRERDPSNTAGQEAPPERYWLSDGGMASLFREYGLPIR